MKLIVAHAQNRVIGNEGKLPWHVKDELAWFHRVTKQYQNVLFGRKTYDDLRHVNFASRRIYVLSQTMQSDETVDVFRTVEEILDFAANNELVVAGGQKIYEQLIPYCDELYISTVYGEFSGDAYFPQYEHLFYAAECLIEHRLFKTMKYVRR